MDIINQTKSKMEEQKAETNKVCAETETSAEMETDLSLENLEDLPLSMLLKPRANSISSTKSTARSCKRSRDENADDLQPEELELDTVSSLRKEIESFMFNDTNKISKTAIKFIMAKWSLLEASFNAVNLKCAKLKGRLEEKEREKEVKPPAPAKPSFTFADAAKAPAKKGTPKRDAGKPGEISVRPPSLVLLVKPDKEDDKRTNDELKTTFFGKISKHSREIKIRNTRKMRHKGLVVEVESSVDEDILSKAELGKVGLHIERPKKMNPSIMVFDVDKKVTKEDITEQLWSKNLSSELGKRKSELVIRPRASYKTKDPEKVNWIVETPGIIFSELMAKRRVYLGFESHRLKQHYNLTRCFKCCAYGHIAKDCSHAQTCEHCGKEGHLKKDCPDAKEKPVCVCCRKARRKDTAHSIKDNKCPEYLKQLEVYNNKVQWT
ncbi:uncharacterized protein LOC143154527 [Ptiloglossa arizonensis]|uniref:uncharacterized protein LOC143154527 n=1 Tax=Ptiloglossa arizonensis TaxID=3350558 RepID=UPI003F9FD830